MNLSLSILTHTIAPNAFISFPVYTVRSKKDREFTSDRFFWSHDTFTKQEVNSKQKTV
jgi:hypothetical protein